MPASSVITDQNLTATQVVQLTRAMLSVASIDGIHPAEAALIGQFYEASRTPDMASVQAVLGQAEAAPFQPAELAGSRADFADTVVLMCLMTAYADGRLTAAERAQIQQIAKALGMSEAQLASHQAQVQDELLGALVHLPDATSVAQVARELA